MGIRIGRIIVIGRKEYIVMAVTIPMVTGHRHHVSPVLWSRR
jgi:hypothetical protein